MTEDKTGESTSTCFVGLSLPNLQGDAATALQDARADGYDFVTTLVPSSSTLVSSSSSSRTDVTQLPSGDWSRCVVGNVAPTENHTAITELEWAHHMHLPAVLLPPLPPPDHDLSSYARAVALACVRAPSFSFQLWIPLTLNATSLKQYQTMYQLCGENHHISAALFLEAVDVTQFSNPNDYVANQLRLLHVAIGCNIRCVVLPTGIFLTNKRGYPTLAKSTQAVFNKLLQRLGRTLRIVIQGPSSHPLPPPSCGTTGCLPYLQYLQHLRRRAEVTIVIDSDEATQETPYLDILQRPLQPLKDHLEFKTYEVFEKDPVKYAQYQRAIYMALQDRVASGARECTVHVVGAGRGPLVSCALRAYQQITVEQPQGNFLQLAVVAVEKNPSAILFLQSKLQTDPLWQACANRMMIVHKDLRSLSLADVGNRPCDIVVSELLGSFGCNELSPECLDSYFRNTDVCHSQTLSIPRSYTAYVSLVHSAALHLEARNQALYPNDSESGVHGMQVAMETPYVVRPHAASQMCEEQACWIFEHPSAHGLSHERNVVLEFSPSPLHGVGFGSGYGARDRLVESAAASLATSPALPDVAWTLTGLIGTFTAELYRRTNGETCQISTAPSTFSSGMFSWFPLYFPLKESLWVPPNATVKVWMWRCADASRIWYEWSASVLHPDGSTVGTSAIHNPGGRSSHVSVLTA